MRTLDRNLRRLISTKTEIAIDNSDGNNPKRELTLSDQLLTTSRILFIVQYDLSAEYATVKLKTFTAASTTKQLLFVQCTKSRNHPSSFTEKSTIHFLNSIISVVSPHIRLD